MIVRPLARASVRSIARLRAAIIRVLLPGYERGINLAGMEYTINKLPGVAGTDWFPPTEADFRYWAGKGLTLVCLPFLWERLQPAVNGPLDGTHKGYLDQSIALAKKYGMRVLLDCHNYGNRDVNGTQRKIGSAELPVAAFADLWGKVAATYADEPGVYGYDLMNEPVDLPVVATPANYHPSSSTVATSTLMNQAAINAIRAVDSVHWIVLEFDRYNGLHQFAANFGSNPEVWWTDPTGLTMPSFHYYQDPDHSGQYSQAWTQATRDRLYSEAVSVFEWAKRKGVKLFMGEYGVPSTNDTSGANYRRDLDTFLTLMDQYGISGTYWAAGIHYSSAPGAQPTSNYTVDALVTQVITSHLASNLVTAPSDESLAIGYGGAMVVHKGSYVVPDTIPQDAVTVGGTPVKHESDYVVEGGLPANAVTAAGTPVTHNSDYVVA
jgi:endoglucanase